MEHQWRERKKKNHPASLSPNFRSVLIASAIENILESKN